MVHCSIVQRIQCMLLFALQNVESHDIISPGKFNIILDRLQWSTMHIVNTTMFQKKL